MKLWKTLHLPARRFADAAYKQLCKLPYYHAFNDRSNEPSIDLAEKPPET